MAIPKPLTAFDPLAAVDVQQDDVLFVVDVHDTSQSSAGSTKTLALSALFGSMVDALLSGVLTFSAAVSKIIPGATSFSIRNHANSADNLLIDDAGNATARTSVSSPTVTASTSVRGHRVGGSVGTPPVVTNGVGVSSSSLGTGGDNTQGLITFSVDNAGGSIAAGDIVLSVALNTGASAYSQIPAVITSSAYLASSVTTAGFNILTNSSIARNGLAVNLKVPYHVLGI